MKILKLIKDLFIKYIDITKINEIFFEKNKMNLFYYLYKL